MTTTLDHARLVKGARVQAPADHPCRRWGRIVHVWTRMPVALVICACGWRGHVPLHRLRPEPVEPPPEPGGYQGVKVIWTRERVIEALRAWAAEHGQAPTQVDWKRSGGEAHPHAALVGQRFGSWSAGLRAAGLEPTDRRRRAEEGA